MISRTRKMPLLLAFQIHILLGLKYNEFSLFVQKLPDIFRKLLANDGDVDGDNDGNDIGENDESDDESENNVEDQRMKEK